MNQLEDPLKNSLILDNIFGRLGLEPQKQFRLVSRTWGDASVGKWRKSALVRIDMEEDEKKEGGKKGMKGFLELWNAKDPANPNSMIRRPFRKFKLFRNRSGSYDFFGCRRRGEEPSSQSQEFWRLCSPQMESLELRRFHCRERFIPTMKWILLEEERSELKELRIDNCYFASNRKEESKQISDVAVPRTAKKLTLLRLNYCIKIDEQTGHGTYLGDERTYEKLLQIVPNLKVLLSSDDSDSKCFMKALASSSTKIEKLEALEIHSAGLQLLLDYIRSAQPVLKMLTIVNIYITDLRKSPFNFQMLMDHCSSTLEEFEVDLPRIPDSFVTDFSGREFPKLRKLLINTDREGIKFDFMALCGMPLLKKFVWKINENYWLPGEESVEYFTEEDLTYDGKDEWMRNETNFDISTPHLEHLEEFHFRLRKNFDVDALRKVGSWMRNVERVSLLLDKETFPVALEQWPNLQKLTLLKGSTVPREDFEEAQKLNKYLVFECFQEFEKAPPEVITLDDSDSD